MHGKIITKIKLYIKIMLINISEWNLNKINKRLLPIIFHRVLKFGIFYRPAKSHYNFVYNKIVVCDRCGKMDLKLCVGYANIDLCLSCIDLLSEEST